MLDVNGNQLNITSSTVTPPRSRGKSSTKKFFITIENLRLIGYSLDPKDELFADDVFSIQHHYWMGDKSLYPLKVIDQLQANEGIVELMFGRYKAEELAGKK